MIQRLKAEIALLTSTNAAAEEALEAVKKERDAMTDRLNGIVAERENDLKERERREAEREKDRETEREMGRQREILAIERTESEWKQRLEAQAQMAAEESETLRGQADRLQRALKVREERHVRESEGSEKRYERKISLRMYRPDSCLIYILFFFVVIIN